MKRSMELELAARLVGAVIHDVYPQGTEGGCMDVELVDGTVMTLVPQQMKDASFGPGWIGARSLVRGAPCTVCGDTRHRRGTCPKRAKAGGFTVSSFDPVMIAKAARKHHGSAEAALVALITRVQEQAKARAEVAREGR